MRARKNEVAVRILGQLLKRAALTASEMARAVGCSPGTASTLLMRMERSGKVIRERHKEGTVVIDQEEGVQRAKYVYRYSLTDEGAERLRYLRNG